MPCQHCHNTTAGVLQSQRAEIEALQADLRKAYAEQERLQRHVAAGRKQASGAEQRWQQAVRARDEAERRLAQVKRAVA